MIFETVLSATNLKYAACVPFFVRTWQRVAPRAKIVVVYVSQGEAVPDSLAEYAEFLQPYEAPVGVSTAFVAQAIRLLWPALLPGGNGVLISDIDMAPAAGFGRMIAAAEAVPGAGFVHISPVETLHEHAMCYNMAPPAVWSEMFGGIKDATDVTRFLEYHQPAVYVDDHGKEGWDTDQQILQKYFEGYTGLKTTIRMRHYGFRRLEGWHHGNEVDTFVTMVQDHRWSDAHVWFANSPWREAELTAVANALKRLG